MSRNEHPNPQWERSSWKNLCGKWEFDYSTPESNRCEEYRAEKLPHFIEVPFCPESKLSGIHYTGFINRVWYRKTVSVSDSELQGRILLHFGAVDYKCRVYINGNLAGTHVGGYSSFSFDITDMLSLGDNEIFVFAQDETASGKQPRGKQSDAPDSYGCLYTRVTGIWQNVWLEFVPMQYITEAKYYPNISEGSLTVIGNVCGVGDVTLCATYNGKPVAQTTVTAGAGIFAAKLTLSEVHLWEEGHGRLYDLTLSFGDDTVKSYFGLRSVSLSDTRFMLNDRCVFQRFVLDQGYYPEGIYTAKSDEQLKLDIELSQAAGFNGARLHQKVFEKRFLYHCDKAGYMVWGEHASWGMDNRNAIAAENFIAEWLEIVNRDFNHPSIIGWCPFNETNEYIEKDEEYSLIETVYKLTKKLDPTRLCIAVSGHYHIDGMEIFDVHDYEERGADVFRENYAHIETGEINENIKRRDGFFQKYDGQPVFMSEYGGFLWNEEDGNDSSWGYGIAPKTKEEFIERYRDYTDVILDNEYMMGFCYTQLYDVEQEKNGLYTYDRKPKFNIEAIRKINTRKAKSEET